MRTSPRPVVLSLEKSGVFGHCNVPVLEAGSVAACPSVMTSSPGSARLGHYSKLLKRSVMCIGKLSLLGGVEGNLLMRATFRQLCLVETLLALLPSPDKVGLV